MVWPISLRHEGLFQSHCLNEVWTLAFKIKIYSYGSPFCLSVLDGWGAQDLQQGKKCPESNAVQEETGVTNSKQQQISF